MKRSIFFPSLPLCFSLTKILRKLLPLLVVWFCLSAFPSRPQGRAGDWSDRGHGERHGERAFYLAILPVRIMSFRRQHFSGVACISTGLSRLLRSALSTDTGRLRGRAAASIPRRTKTSQKLVYDSG